MKDGKEDFEAGTHTKKLRRFPQLLDDDDDDGDSLKLLLLL